MPAGRKPRIEPGVLILVGIAGLVIYSANKNHSFGKVSWIYIAVLIPSIILHEVSHGWVANMFGDSTAKNAGRLTLNPLRHVDPWGTVILPLFLIFSHVGAFGYAKPVPVNVSRMTRNKAMLVSLAGPGMNIFIALVAALLINVLLPNEIDWLNSSRTDYSNEFLILYQLGISNVVLAVFNLIPIPPLDGSAVVERFLPAKYWPQYLKFRRYSMLILLFIVLAFGGALQSLFDPFETWWKHLLP